MVRMLLVISGAVSLAVTGYWWGWTGVGALALLLSLAGAAWFAIPKAYVLVPEKQVAVVFRAGERAFSRFLPAGRHWLIPGVEYVESTISTGPRAEVGACAARLTGGVSLKAHWKAIYYLDPLVVQPEMRSNMARTLAHNPAGMLGTHVPNCIQHTLGHYTVEELCQPGKQKRLEKHLRDMLEQRLASYGFVLVRFVFQEIVLPEQVQRAIDAAYERKLQAQAEAEAMSIRQQALRAFSAEDIQRQIDLERLRVLEHKQGDALVYMETRPYHPHVGDERARPLPSWKVLKEAGAGAVDQRIS